MVGEIPELRLIAHVVNLVGDPDQVSVGIFDGNGLSISIR